MIIEIDPRNYNDAYYPYVFDETRTQIFFGGSSSGKSVFLAMRCIEDILRGGRNYLVLRNVGASIRTSVYNEIVKVIQSWELTDLFNISRGDLVINCKNGYQILFKGLDDVQKIKSVTPQKGQLTDIWIEEATETKYSDVKELTKRLRGPSLLPKRMILSFNPIMRSHWIYKEYFQGNWHEGDKCFQNEHLLILKTTYKDNAFLSTQDVYELENEKDLYYYNVYTLGDWGTLGRLVFTNWQTEDLSDIRDSFGAYKNGLDFGFTNDPTAFVRTAHRGNKLYITHAFYEYGLLNPDIASRILQIAPATKASLNQELVRCDAVEPKSIYDLRLHGVNAVSAYKGAGSLNYGIDYLKRFEIIIHKELQPVINEFELYQYQQNKQGETLNIPQDKNNHAIDSLRYAESDALLEQEDDGVSSNIFY